MREERTARWSAEKTLSLLAETYLALGGVHVDVRFVQWDSKIEYGQRMPFLGQETLVGFRKGEG